MCGVSYSHRAIVGRDAHLDRRAALRTGEITTSSVIQPDYAFHDVTLFEQESSPWAHFAEHCYGGDPTNWWIPNRATVPNRRRSFGASQEVPLVEAVTNNP